MTKSHQGSTSNDYWHSLLLIALVEMLYHHTVLLCKQTLHNWSKDYHTHVSIFVFHKIGKITI